MERLELDLGEVDLERLEVRAPGGVRTLSPTDRSLLAFLAARPGRPQSRDALRDAVWGHRAGVRARSVDSAIRRLRCKIERDPSRPRHIVTVRGAGWAFEPLELEPSPSNLDLDDEPFFGRTGVLDLLLDHFAGGARAVTLRGPGGMGKTRLARRCGLALAARGLHPGGVWFCDLASSRSATEAAVAVARALGVGLRAAGHPVAQVGDALALRGPTWLLLDHCDQVSDGVAAAVVHWHEASADTAVLATSREALGQDGERVVDLAPLSDVDAADLFVARAKRQAAAFTLRARGADALAQLVRRLDGLPLAVELAAAHLPRRTVPRLLDDLGRRLDLLTDRQRHDARHRALTAALDATWDRMDPWEQRAAARLTVFRGGFTEAGAGAVMALDGVPGAPSGIDALDLLHRRSLVTVTAAGRFDVPQGLTDHLADRLERSVEAPATRERHAAWYATQGSDATAQLRGPGHADAIGWLIAEAANLEAALEVATETTAPALARALDALWVWNGPASARLGVLARAREVAPGDRWIAGEIGPALRDAGRLDEADAALHLALRSTTGIAHARVTSELGKLAWIRGRHDEAAERFAEAAAAAAAARDRRVRSGCHGWLARAHLRAGRLFEAREHALQALAGFEDLGDLPGQASVAATLALVDGFEGHDGSALERVTWTLQTCRALADRRAEAAALGQRAAILWGLAEHREARRCLHRAMALARAIGDPQRVAGHELGLALLAADAGDAAQAESRARAGLSRATRPDRLTAWLWLADLRRREGRLHDARRAVERALELLRTPTDESRARSHEAVLMASDGRLPEAAAWLDEPQVPLDGPEASRLQSVRRVHRVVVHRALARAGIEREAHRAHAERERTLLADAPHSAMLRWARRDLQPARRTP